MSNLTTCALARKPIAIGLPRHRAESDDNLTERSARNPDVAASDWRGEAEARGRAAYENAVAEPQTTAEPLAWLWRSEDRDDMTAPQGSVVKTARACAGIQGAKRNETNR
jgi:hypothetical protein